ncbi:MAG TPA: hypothetical protein VN623_11600, partial [Hyphomicrobium sp.]|uniref:hypothetical protein n=1 Tax=Hyphomicrobium sp. TaxID=82 RepID=UPI002C808E2D
MANFDPRPHVAPCACELCQEWARAVVSTKAERKPDRMPQLTEKPDMPLADFMTRIIAVAC